MRIPTLDEVRQQCRITHSDEDELLKLYISAAKLKTEQYIKRKLFDSEIPENESDGLVITDDIKVAMLLFIGHLYENRESTTELSLVEIPLGFKFLLDSYRNIII